MRLSLRCALFLALSGCIADPGFDGGRSYACDPTLEDLEGEPQCAEGWRCSTLRRICVEVLPPSSQPCLRDDDCTNEWICGRERLCRDPEVNGPYECEDDRDCVPSWACGRHGLCVDPALDAPDSDAPFAPLQPATQQNPATAKPPDTLSISMPSTYAEYTVTRADGPTVTTYVTPDYGPPRSHAAEGELVFDFPYQPSSSSTATLPEPPLALGARHPGSALALTSAGLWAQDGGAMDLIDSRLAGMKRMAITPALPSTPIAAWNGDRAAVGIIDGAGVKLFALEADGGVSAPAPTGLEMDEVGLFQHPAFVSVYMVFATTERGMFVRTTDAGTAWQPFAVPPLFHADCPVDGGAFIPSDLIATGIASSYRLYAVVAPVDGGVERRAIQFETAAGDTGPCDGQFANSSFRTAIGADCPLCPPSANLVDVRPGVTPSKLWVRCLLGPGDERTFEQTLSPACGLREVVDAVGRTPTTSNRVVRELRAFTNAEGQLFGGAQSIFTTPSVLLAEAPVELFRVRGVLSASTGTESGNRTEHAQIEGFGLVRTTVTSDRPMPAGQHVSPRFAVDWKSRSVRDARDWEDGGIPRVVARIDPTFIGRPTLPTQVAQAPRADGGTTLLLTTGDVLLSADISRYPYPPDEDPPELGTRLSPLPRTPIRDLVVTEATEPNLAEGYLLTDSDVFAFYARSEQRWDARSVGAPEGDWLALWKEGSKVRLGFRDGRVFSLPGKLALAPAIPDAEVSDFAPFCGRTYAATSRGLLRLEPNGVSEGVWVPEERFTQALPEPRARDLAGARLFYGDGELFWAGGAGTVLRFEAAGACPKEAP